MPTTATTTTDLHADAAARMATLTTAQVCEQWMHTDELMADYALPQDDRLAVIQVRQWIMADLERRDDAALVAWIGSGQTDPAPFYGVEARA